MRILHTLALVLDLLAVSEHLRQDWSVAPDRCDTGQEQVMNSDVNTWTGMDSDDLPPTAVLF